MILKIFKMTSEGSDAILKVYKIFFGALNGIYNKINWVSVCHFFEMNYL